MADGKRSRHVVTEDRLRSELMDALSTLKDLASLYDEGKRHVAASMATEISKVLTANPFTIRERGSRRFSSPDFTWSDRNIAPETALIGGKIDNSVDPPYAEFRPTFYDNAIPTKRLPFREWWNNDVIWRAGAYATGGRIDRGKRETLTRRRFIEDVRNTLGAHTDVSQHQVIEHLRSAASLGLVLVAERPDGSELSTDDGSLPIRVTPAEAFLRQITFEVLLAYEQDAERPSLHGVIN